MLEDASAPDSARESAHDDELYERLEHRLESLGILEESPRRRGPAERAMLRTLATRDRPLLDPEGFDRAHRTLARALEALTFSGKEAPTLPRRLAPFRPVMGPAVRLVAGWIVDGQTKTVVGDVRRLYELRETNAEWNSPDHQRLRRARMQIQMIDQNLGASRLTLPVFLLSGAFLSALFSVLQAVAGPALGSTTLLVLLILLSFVLLLGIAATVLQGAAVARMRLRLALKAPLGTLYARLGSTADPPQDRCFAVAVLALGFFALAAVLVPSGLYLLLHMD